MENYNRMHFAEKNITWWKNIVYEVYIVSFARQYALLLLNSNALQKNPKVLI